MEILPTPYLYGVCTLLTVGKRISLKIFISVFYFHVVIVLALPPGHQRAHTKCIFVVGANKTIEHVQ